MLVDPVGRPEFGTFEGSNKAQLAKIAKAIFLCMGTVTSIFEKLSFPE
jgi:hypothetical protein